MDRDHRLDAPDNESLKNIEQVSDRSELSTMYPTAHQEWEGADLISREAREEKRTQEQLRINLTIRKWFAVIGVLVPLPLVVASFLFAIGATFIELKNLVTLLLPIVGVATLWFYISYRSIKRVYGIFYEHSLNATPFVATLVALILLSLQGLYVTMLGFYTNSLILNSIISSVVLLAISVLLSGLLVLIWPSPRISAAYKLGCIGIIAGVILVVTLLVNVF